MTAVTDAPTNPFVETAERVALRQSVAALATKYGQE